VEHLSQTLVTINGEPLKKCKTFKYLRNTVTVNAKLDDELYLRIGEASAAYGKLSTRLWANRYVLMKFKCQVYRAKVLDTLIYDAEAWSIYSVQVGGLQAYVMRHLHSIMGVSWKDKITNQEILKRTSLLTFEIYPHSARNIWRLWTIAIYLGNFFIHS